MEKGITVGLDMGDRNHSVCVLDAEGRILERTTVRNTARGIRKCFGDRDSCRVALEAGTHSGWVSRVLEELGHEVLVGNPRKLRVIWDSEKKDDERDAEMLARIARFDPHLLYPIHHRSEPAHSDLAVVKARDMLVKTRSSLISHARGAVKTLGERISSCSAESFHIRLLEEMPAVLMHHLWKSGESYDPFYPHPAKDRWLRTTPTGEYVASVVGLREFDERSEPGLNAVNRHVRQVLFHPHGRLRGARVARKDSHDALQSKPLRSPI